MGQALYGATIAACVFGCILRIMLAGYYRVLLRSLKCMKTTKNKWMKILIFAENISRHLRFQIAEAYLKTRRAILRADYLKASVQKKL